MKKVYLAGPFFDDQQLTLIKQVEQSLADNPTVGSFFSPRLGAEDSAEDVGSARWAKATFDEDIKEINQAQVVVAILDYPHGNPDSGTAFEIGYAWRQGLPIVLLLTNEGVAVNIMLSQAATAFLTNPSDLARYDFDKLAKIPYRGKNF